MDRINCKRAKRISEKEKQLYLYESQNENITKVKEFYKEGA